MDDIIAKQTFSGDPSGIVQSFPKFDIQLLCCRYWWLKNWEHAKLGFPFWRIYYNFHEGAHISYKGEVYHLNPGTLYVIAPNTDYSTWLYDHPIPSEHYLLTGGSLTDVDERKRNSLLREGAIGHMFIHFNLNYPYVVNQPGIYAFPADKKLREMTQLIRSHLLQDNRNFDVTTEFAIYTLICSLLCSMNIDSWEENRMDIRIVRVVDYIKKHLDGDLSNEVLASKVCITPNSLLRIFKSEVGTTLQAFVRQQRIAEACSLFVHTNLSIDQVATKTGFSNRYHFTRVFHEETNTTPARYKKTEII
jgi:AraC-like DNA-binding protein